MNSWPSDVGGGPTHNTKKTTSCLTHQTLVSSAFDFYFSSPLRSSYKYPPSTTPQTTPSDPRLDCKQNKIPSTTDKLLSQQRKGRRTKMDCSKALAVVLICLLVLSATADESCYCKCIKRCRTIPGTVHFDCSKACEAGCVSGGHEGADESCNPDQLGPVTAAGGPRQP
ncbi:hypothetical protein BHE74_00026112 [Ensete ventricosum]|nr:hypothetical protein BHE74_00026112 [Ensete ventricosum]